MHYEFTSFMEHYSLDFPDYSRKTHPVMLNPEQSEWVLVPECGKFLKG